MRSWTTLRCRPPGAGWNAGNDAAIILGRLDQGTMTRPGNAPPVALGFRVKSGWTVAVLVAGPAASPVVLDRRIVTLSDPAVDGSNQPYHGGTGQAETDPARVAKMVDVVERSARQSLGALFAGYRADGHALAGVGI